MTLISSVRTVAPAAECCCSCSAVPPAFSCRGSWRCLAIATRRTSLWYHYPSVTRYRERADVMKSLRTLSCTASRCVCVCVCPQLVRGVRATRLSCSIGRVSCFTMLWLPLQRTREQLNRMRLREVYESYRSMFRVITTAAPAFDVSTVLSLH